MGKIGKSDFSVCTEYYGISDGRESQNAPVVFDH